MYPQLIAISGAIAGTEWELPPGKEVFIGRDGKNDIVIGDPIVSRVHCKVWNDGELVWVKNLNMKGTWVNDRFVMRGMLDHRDHMEVGSTTLLVALRALTGDMLPSIIDDEIDRQRRMETLRADYTVREDEAIRRKDVNEVLLRMIESLKVITDLEALKRSLLEMALRIIPAQRAAFLINGPRVAPDIHNFISGIYLERDYPNPAPFKLSGTALRALYSEKVAQLTNDITPVICAPFAPRGVLQGVIYVEGLPGRMQFEHEHRRYLESIGTISETAVLLNNQIAEIKDTRDYYKKQVEAEFVIIGESPQIQEVRGNMALAAKSEIPVLIIGETGTGKELVSHGIHVMSRRSESKMITVNCAAIAATLVESELFGYEKGAFTGANARKKGKLEVADGGTFFMDEVGDLPLEMQAKLLRVLEQKEFERVGGVHIIKVNIRIIAATHLDLKKLVAQGKFRRDLMTRLDVFPIYLPPLRERRSDIPLIFNHYLEKLGAGTGIESVEEKAMDGLMAYDWPGNIRELKNLVEWAVLKCPPPVIRWETLRKRLEDSVVNEPDVVNSGAVQIPIVGKSFQQVADYAAKQARKALAEQVIAENNGNKEAAAQQLSCSVQYLYRVLKAE